MSITITHSRIPTQAHILPAPSRQLLIAFMSSDSLSSHIALGLVLSLTSIGVGYKFATVASSSSQATPPSTGVTNIPQTQVQPALSEPEVQTPEVAAEDDAEDIPDGDLDAVSAGWTEQCKMVLIVRTDLKMAPGTIATQLSVRCYKALTAKNPKLLRHWEFTGQAKIALKGKSEDQLLELQAIAKSLNLCARVATSRELGDNVRTVLAIGPAPVNLVNEVTGKLRLL
ncbi:hypothetical protein D9619_003340 [Psilocybe cf. subviscida]|uniref:peptidyl-tRNA hydrolase n=1 Tax=Psilocybe cf. subviscida TaxID=2480587 RepID=A0A8H5AVX0_9AGAR|nr:hypothetical protein D9619_003340 [Psilocybe cf. subviscida]